MVAVFVFYIHLVAASAIFTKRWQESGKGEAFLAVGFMALIFGVGWSVATVFLKFFFAKEGLSVWFDRDQMSLALLTVLESIFYYAYIKWERKKIKPQH
ncbi:MAG: hypothetical protein QME58_01760 [Bacteroidota bacterium]|nr:hypothetical protein [Bacteroidota bacterium]